eukprot:m51a1_g6571 hypothetical protein (541) ;mRNA; r:182206-184038
MGEFVCQVATFVAVMTVFLSITIYLVTVPPGPCGSSSSSVTLSAFGMICGGLAPDGSRSFYAVPYAMPPAGPLRWRAPVPWSGNYASRRLLDARAPGAPCPQRAAANASEDCLRLNVFAPAVSGAALLPVLFYIHGGAFYSGSATGAGIDGLALANSVSAVVVTVNYRLGPFGFLALDGLMNESGTTGNYGLLDQMEAMRWVSKNIKAFGGDPDRILLFGESAGATSVISHVCSPVAKDLYRAVAAQSGAMAARTLQAATARGSDFARRVGCARNTTAETVQCMRAVKSNHLVDADAPSVVARTWLPTIDGYVLSASLASMFAAGNFSRTIPMLIGSNADEGTLFVYRDEAGNPTSPVPADKYHAALEALFPDFPKDFIYNVMDKYPVNTTGDNRPNLARAFGDYWYRCSARRSLNAASSKGATVHGFVFAGKPACEGTLEGLGSFHGAESMYLFGTPSARNCTLADDDEVLAKVMRSYWAHHVEDSVNTELTDGRIEWPQYAASEPKFLWLDPAGLRLAGSNGDDDLCDWWDRNAQHVI